MRFYDFIADICETSGRVALRDLHISAEAITDLTVKTLLRPDVIRFFDNLMAGYPNPLLGTKLIMYYVIMYGYTVNIKPSPQNSDLLNFSNQILTQLNGIDFNSTKYHIFCATSSALRPQAIFNKIENYMNVQRKSGLYCTFSYNRPLDSLIDKLCGNKFRDASLLLYAADEAEPRAQVSGADRIVYFGNIFKSRYQTLNGLYIGALS